MLGKDAKETSILIPKDKDIQNDLLIHVYMMHVRVSCNIFSYSFFQTSCGDVILLFLIMSFALFIMVSYWLGVHATICV